MKINSSLSPFLETANSKGECMVFAAGLGTRLESFTEHKPKALVEVNGCTLLKINLGKIIASGFSHIVINVHAFAEQIIEFIEKQNFEADIFISDESEMLLDTGGGLLKALPLFSGKEPILLHNVDVLSHINLANMYQNHLSKTAAATLAVSKRHTSRYLLFHQNRLNGWENKKTGEKILSDKTKNTLDEFAFSGIHIIEPSLLKATKLHGKFSMIDLYLETMQQSNIQAYEHKAEQWLDVGTPERLKTAQQFLLS